METKCLVKDKQGSVFAVYVHGELFYTVTRTYDEDGYVEKTIKVFRDGTVDEQYYGQ